MAKEESAFFPKASAVLSWSNSLDGQAGTRESPVKHYLPDEARGGASDVTMDVVHILVVTQVTSCK